VAQPTTSPLLLASASPRRRDLLLALGVSFEVHPADVDEAPHAGESPVATAERLARAKAHAVAARHPNATILAADTIVTIDGDTLGKPRDADENAAFLRRLAGRPHTVITAHAMQHAGRLATETVTTTVHLRSLSHREIDAWIARGEGLDKAGGYAIQDMGAALVGDIHGCYGNVVGLSLPAVVRLAAKLEVTLV